MGLARRLGIEPGEGHLVAWACAYFFLLLSSYYVIRPLRDEMGLSGTDDRLSWLFLGTLAGTLLANPLFAALVARLPRRTFIPRTYHGLALCLCVFWAALRLLAPAARPPVAAVFFVWASVFNLFAVSVFWGFMADLFDRAAAKRLFGLIGTGGTLGAIAGSTLVTRLAPLIGPLELLLAAALLLEAATFAVTRLAALRPEAAGPPPARVRGGGALDGLSLVARSPYLLMIAGFLALYAFSSTALYFEQARIARATFATSAERVAFLARIDMATNAVVLVLQTFVSGRLIGWLGIAPSLAVMPLVTQAGLAWLAVAPSAAALTFVQAGRRAAEFALVKPAREVLFTAVPRAEKYSAKNLVDTFVYRGADALAAWTDRLMAAAGIGAAGAAWCFAPLAAAWCGLSVLLGRRFARR